MIHVRMPAETVAHAATWMAWPYRDDEWPDLEGARREILRLAAQIGTTEPVKLLVHPDLEVPSLPKNVEAVRLAYGDGWVRDSGPIWLWSDEGRRVASFEFNGWGGRYLMEGDADLAVRVAEHQGLPADHHLFVLEGGAVESDGEGTIITTRDCLLNPNRRPPIDLDAQLRAALGAERILWFEGALENDHTDGHIDTLVRFVAPGEVLCMRASDPHDPNAAMLTRLEEQLRESTDARGRRLKVHTLPSPGRVQGDPAFGEEDEVLPASYMNFVIARDQVIVPIYGSTQDDQAVSAIRALFPDRHVRGLCARSVIGAGGAFHCLTHDEPAPESNQASA